VRPFWLPHSAIRTQVQKQVRFDNKRVFCTNGGANASRTLLIVLACITAISPSAAQKDPGPRRGPAGAGGPYPSLNSNEQTAFSNAKGSFMEVDSVSGTIAGERGTGLGPTFNGTSCGQCHAQPTVGGSSPGLSSPQNPIPNPQVALANLDGANNVIPSFITSDGPVRETRFIRVLNQRGTPPDGGVHDLYTIAGRSDAPRMQSCPTQFQYAA
jgi:hypothetical protein